MAEVSGHSEGGSKPAVVALEASDRAPEPPQGDYGHVWVGQGCQGREP